MRLVMELTLAMLSTEYQLCVGLLDRKTMNGQGGFQGQGREAAAGGQ